MKKIFKVFLKVNLIIVKKRVTQILVKVGEVLTKNDKTQINKKRATILKIDYFYLIFNLSLKN